jgi:hypothetical protein
VDLEKEHEIEKRFKFRLLVFCLGRRQELRLGVLSKFCGQATKGAWWMPWQKKAMKDVASCDKPRGAANRHYIRGCPNGETHWGKTSVRPAEYIGRCEQTQGSEPSQYLEEKKATAIPKVVASEIGTSPNPFYLRVRRGL